MIFRGESLRNFGAGDGAQTHDLRLGKAFQGISLTNQKRLVLCLSRVIFMTSRLASNCTEFNQISRFSIKSATNATRFSGEV